VPLLLDYQVVDINTCEPIPDVYVEIWHCNATGVYGGVVAQGNGDSSDQTNLDNTWLRGIQPTNEDGVAQFESIFPGHYVGRTTHIHIAVHANATLLANNTLGHETFASHVGQAFFDQALIDAVEKLAPYTDNRQPLTTNRADWIMAQEAGTDGVDPVMEYTLLGDKLEDGLFAWLAFGVNSTFVRKVQPAVLLGPDGGVPNPNGGFPGGGFPGGPGGPGGPGFPGFPSGFPSGFPTGFPGFPQPTGAPAPAPTP
jgi:protocatechuate 3,4-dioxygenase beta subunit